MNNLKKKIIYSYAIMFSVLFHPNQEQFCTFYRWRRGKLIFYFQMEITIRFKKLKLTNSIKIKLS